MSGKGDHDPLYRTLCLALSDQPGAVVWSALTPANWQQLQAMAQAEGVAPLLYHRLARGRRMEGGRGKTEAGIGQEEEVEVQLEHVLSER